MKAKVILVNGKQNTVLRGHPWIFPKAIAQYSGKLITGELVEIIGSEGQSLGFGAYNEHSLYRVRVLALSNEQINSFDYKSLITHRIRQASLVRRCLDLPNEQTNAYRLFNSEADGLSGLTIDCFNDYCVIASSAYWVELNKSIIVHVLQELLPHNHIIWLPQNKPLSQDGWKEIHTEKSQGSTQVLEEGVLYHVEFAQTQKTGLFLDQRENHKRIAKLSRGKRVLDLYTFTGGFALHAAKAGALHVTAVDSSAQAIEQAKNNAVLNHLNTIEFIKADAREYLKMAGEYDVVILDPPKLVPSQKHLQQAKNYYRFLHREAFKYMKPGSLLMTCNCSSALSSQDFCSLVSAQAVAMGKQARILGVYGPASCHPTLAAFPEGNYLTAVLLALV
ncbi:TPA: class I SAM-dependent rRNA methyltransferase [Legionella pneumophila]|nr:class I SAM-dependent rRNA methyltransferase [Legionella pneumophila]HAT8334449.1 methyltransferase domain-containing protein [Legionella pneumophila]HAU1067697.1 class I SAM-dependent rRNA methyltransferase [Legionella pneumophila]HAU1224047.1 class I SAM-dependent rRNA methyltransferase [Legionella pneumophila]HAU1555998.1 class I SAM-dependent rRNA methyltransferase [Legionella pneumophila]